MMCRGFHFENISIKETEKQEKENNKLRNIKDKKGLLETYKNELQYLETLLPQSTISIDNVRNIGSEINVTKKAKLQNDEYSLIINAEGHTSLYKNNVPRVICSVVMTDGVSGINAKTMEEVNDLINKGYYAIGYGVLNPYSTSANNVEGFFKTDDVVGLVRK